MIIFTDLSEVLIQGIYGIENLVDQHYGISVAAKFIKRKHETEELFGDLMRGCITENKFWDLFLSGGGWPFGITEAKALCSHSFANEIPGTYDTYCSIVKYPKSIKGDRVSKARINSRPDFWLVSDHIAEREQELELLHPEIFELFSRRIWSFEEVAIKKDPGFFYRLVKRNDLDPEEIIFIDDDMDNINAAAKVGIHTLWFRNYRHMRYVLVRRGFGFHQSDLD